MKKATLILMLSLASLCIQAQETRPVQTVVCQDEQFLLDTSYNEREDRMNFEFHASDSIVLDPGFSRKSLLSSTYYTMDLTVDVLGVYPPGHGLQGGPNEADTGYVGAIGGTIDVSTMGGATYTIPLELPAGINGMQPSLALVYNSQGGNGLLGWKWDLAGLSSITRTGRTRYHDGAVGGVTLNDETDRFMLDGQRLIQVQDYGDSIDYKTEQDGMARTRAYVNTLDGRRVIDNFKVWNPDGTICEYGMTNNSHIVGQDGRPNAVCWLINKKSDRNGNAILFAYDTNQQEGEYYISRIQYTRNEALSVKPEFVIDFVYSNTGRPDYDFRYVGGVLQQQKKYLEQINVSRDGTTNPLVQYAFEYEIHEHSHLYDSVQMYQRVEKIHYRKGGMSLNPTLIKWTSKGENNVMRHWNISDTAIYQNFPFVGDFNADGYSDLVVVPFKGDTMYYTGYVSPHFFLNNKSQEFILADIGIEPLPNTLDWIYVLDINDDGYDDLVTVSYDSVSSLGRTDIMVYKNTRSQNSISFVPAWEQPLYLYSKVRIAVGDFLGQGKRSMLVFGINGDGNASTRAVLIICNNGSWCHTYPVVFESGATMSAHQIEPGEFLGDGRTELFVMGDNESGVWRLEESNDSLIIKKELSVPGILFTDENARSQVFAGDYNGDGLTDLLSYSHTGSVSNGNNIWHMYYSKSNGFYVDTSKPCFELQYYIMPKHELFGNSLRRIRLAEKGTWNSVCASDFDGDGITDVAVIRNTGSYSYINIYFRFRKESGRFLTTFNGSSYNGQHYGIPINCKTQYMHIGNFLGKENCSFLGLRKVTGNSVPHLNLIPRLYNLKSVGELNNVYSITDGMGNCVFLNYSILLEEYKSIGYGVRRLAVPIRILESSMTYNTSGKLVTTAYNFSSPCFHRDGHGFLGFRQVCTTELNNCSNLNRTEKIYSLAVMKHYALLLPLEERFFVFPSDDETPVVSSVAKYTFTNVTNTMDTLVTCPALTRKTVKKYNVDNPWAGMMSKEITEYGYNYTPVGDGHQGMYTHSYDCIETHTGVDDSNVNEVADCEFRTSELCTYDNIHVSNWILGRLTSQVTTRSKTGKEDKVNTILLSYNSNSNYQVSSKTDIPNTVQSLDRLTIRTDYQYHPTGNLRSETVSAPYGNQNELESTTEWKYGEGNLGRLVTKETVSAGMLEYETVYSYDEYDNIDTVVDLNGLITTYVTNPLGITSIVNNPDGTAVGQAFRWSKGQPFAPDGASYYSWSRSSGQGKQLAFYHKSGEVLRTVTFSPKGKPIFTDVHYNERGLADSVSNPYFLGDTLQWTAYAYDRLERLATVATPDGATTEIIHEGLVTRTCVSDGNGNEQRTKRTDNVMGWTVSNRDPKNITVNYDYYADGNLASTQVGSNSASRITVSYDNRGNRSNLTDPDYGTSTFLYDAYGRLKQRVSPKLDVTSYQYDAMGRLVSKHESGENATTSFGYDETDGLKGTLQSIVHGSQNVEFGYDEFLRPVMVSEELFGTIYRTRLEYDRASRVCKTIYPTGVTVLNEYSDYGHLVAITDAADNPLWEAGLTNAAGQLLRSTMGGNIVTTRQFDCKMHYITGIATSNNIQNLSYCYDKFGNLASRTDSLRMMTETFGYDKLNRLTNIDFGDSHCQIRYDNLGRMVKKQAVLWKYGGPHVQTVFSAPQFDETKIHALTDANAHPDWFNTDQLDVTYTSFDKVSHASIGDNEVNFLYGFNEERVRMSERYNTMERRKTYVTNCEFITESDSGIMTEKSWTFLTCPTGVFAVVEKQGDTETLHYILKDHQGSWTVVTDAEGTVEQELSYDAWGNLRDPDTWCVDTSIKPMFDRGYTGQEHLTAFGLVNMNGRMYDPVMSSFLSVDRYVQQPGNSQGFNRYAYCMYNPLKYVDPSGWEAYGLTHSNPFHENWSRSFVEPVYEPRDFQSAYYLYNLAFYGNLEGVNTGGNGLAGGSVTSYNYKSSYGYYVTHYANSVYNYCFPSTQLQLIRNWQENPSFTTNKELREAGITNLTVGIINGQIGGEDGYRNSYYQWIDDVGMTHLAAAYFEYVGGHENNWYVMSNAPLWSYATFCYGDYTVPSLLQKGFASTSSVAAIGVGAVKATEGVKKLSQIPGKVGKIARCTNVLGYVGPAFNLVYNFKQMRNGQMTSNEFLIRSAVSIVEIGLANVPIPIIGQACMIASIALTAYDVSGGFDNTLYNQSWIGKK